MLRNASVVVIVDANYRNAAMPPHLSVLALPFTLSTSGLEKDVSVESAMEEDSRVPNF